MPSDRPKPREFKVVKRHFTVKRRSIWYRQGGLFMNMAYPDGQFRNKR